MGTKYKNEAPGIEGDGAGLLGDRDGRGTGRWSGVLVCMESETLICCLRSLGEVLS